MCEMPHHKGLLWAEGPCGGGSPKGREPAGPLASLTPVFPAGAPSSLLHGLWAPAWCPGCGGVCALRPTLWEPEGSPTGDLDVLCLAEAVLALVSPPRGCPG